MVLLKSAVSLLSCEEEEAVRPACSAAIFTRGVQSVTASQGRPGPAPGVTPKSHHPCSSRRRGQGALFPLVDAPLGSAGPFRDDVQQMGIMMHETSREVLENEAGISACRSMAGEHVRSGGACTSMSLTANAAK